MSIFITLFIDACRFLRIISFALKGLLKDACLECFFAWKSPPFILVVVFEEDKEEDGGEPYTDTVFSYLVRERIRFLQDLEDSKQKEQELDRKQSEFQTSQKKENIFFLEHFQRLTRNRVGGAHG